MAFIVEKLPNGTPVKNVAMLCSGGADSSLLLYIVTKEIIEKNLDIGILPITIRRLKPHNPFYAAQVVEKIEELLNYTYKDHMMIYPPKMELTAYDPNCPYDSERKFFHGIKNELRNSGEYQIFYSGTSEAPPDNIRKTWGKDVSREILLERNPNKHDQKEISLSKNFMVWDVWKNKNKKQLAKIYKQEGLTDILFPLTRSCESWTQSIGHCGTCWWCLERNWAFGRLE